MISVDTSYFNALADHPWHGCILTTDRRDFGAYRWKCRKPFQNLLEA